MKIISAIWGWFSGSTVGKYLIEGIVLIGAIGGLYAKIRLDGEHAQQAKDTDATLKDVQAAREVEKATASKSDAQVDSELVSKWDRP